MMMQLWVASAGENNWAHLRRSAGDSDQFMCGVTLTGFSYWLPDMGDMQQYAWCADCLRALDRAQGGDGNLLWIPTHVGDEFLEEGSDAGHYDEQTAQEAP